MDKLNIIRKVISKLETQKEKMSVEDAWDILYKNFVEKTEVVKPGFELNMTADLKETKLLRNIYDNAPVKQLYTYGTNTFGFKIDDLRVDLDHGNLQIKRGN